MVKVGNVTLSHEEVQAVIEKLNVLPVDETFELGGKKWTVGNLWLAIDNAMNPPTGTYKERYSGGCNTDFVEKFMNT